MPILFYDRIASMHSPLTRRHQFANKNINSVISITSWADATHESNAMYCKTSLDTIFIKPIDKIILLNDQNNCTKSIIMIECKYKKERKRLNDILDKNNKLK